jgi:hypothetical protein
VERRRPRRRSRQVGRRGLVVVVAAAGHVCSLARSTGYLAVHMRATVWCASVQQAELFI